MACTKICAFFFFFLIMASLGSSLAALYQVGDSAGWNSNGTNYQSWASTKTFYIGDAIVFKYKPGTQNVLQVIRQDYEGCSTTIPITTYNSGTDTVFFFSAGDYYFISGYPNMCQQGQKLMIKVLYTTNPNPTPLPPITTPTPPGGRSQPGTDNYYWTSTAASNPALNLHRRLIVLVTFASFALSFFYLH